MEDNAAMHAFQALRNAVARPTPNHRLAAGILLIAAAACIVYLPAMRGGFLFDDDLLLGNNRLIKAPDGLYRFWCGTEPSDHWPLTNTTLWIEWRLWGSAPTGYHLANLGTHIAESLLIWLILRKLSIPGAFIAAAIFALHPVNVESVAWIASRKNLAAMLFFLLSILWYLNHLKRLHSSLIPHSSSPIPHPSSFSRWYWLSLAAFTLAMLGKGSVAVLPLLLLLIIWWLRRLTWRDIAQIVPFFAVAAPLAAVNVWFQTLSSGGAIRTADFSERLAAAGCAVWFYLYKALAPVNLSFVYPQWRIAAGDFLHWLPLAAALTVTVVLWLYRNSWGRPYFFAWGFFCIALVPALGFTDVGFMKYSLVADRYQHIALIGAIALCAAGLSAWRRQAQPLAGKSANCAAIVAAGALMLLTWQQSGLYRDAVALYEATLEENPQSWMIHNNLASLLIQAGRSADAIRHCNEALRYNPNYPDAHDNLGVALFQSGRTQEAIDQYNEALRINPRFVQARNNLANALNASGQPQEATKQYELALRIDPENAEVENNLGNALAGLGRLDDAIEHYRQALRIRPDFAGAYNNLGFALFRDGEVESAIEHYEHALRIDPDYADAHHNLGLALAQSGKTDQALEQLQTALRLRPDSPEGYAGLAMVYARLNDSANAVAAAKKGLELARSKDQTSLAEQIEDWLRAYSARIKE